MKKQYIRYKTILVVLILLVSCKPMQQLSLDFNETAELKLIQFDHLGNYYISDDVGKIKKFDASGKFLTHYSNRYMGDLSSFDISDPLKIMVFYKSQQQIVILDNSMSEMALLDLSILEDSYIEAVVKALDGNFWLYDSNKEVLLKTDENLEVIMEGFPMKQEGIDGLIPKQMKVDKQSLYVNDPLKGILVFDNYTDFKQILPIKDIIIVQSVENGFYFVRGNKLYRYDMILYDEKLVYEIELDSNYLSFGIRNDLIYFLEKDKLLKKHQLNEGN